MGMKENAYLFGWVITGYIRVLIVNIIILFQSLIIFEVFWYISNIIFKIEWDEEFHVSFLSLLWPYILFAFAVLIININRL